MAPRKICAQRKTKEFPNVYLRKELESMARKKGATPAEIRSMNKKELCGYLNIKWNTPRSSKRSVKKTSASTKKDYIVLNDRPCDVTKSKKYPDAYSKVELVKLAISQLGYTKAVANRKTKKELCIDLNDSSMKHKKSTKTQRKSKGDCV